MSEKYKYTDAIFDGEKVWYRALSNPRKGLRYASPSYSALLSREATSYSIHSVTPTESDNLWWSGVHSPRLFAGVAG